MGFFSHAAMLGVGYWIGKSYCFRYKIHQLPTDPDASEISFRIERKEGAGPFFGHPWWNHHHQCWHQYHHRTENTVNSQNAPSQVIPKKNVELLEVETNQ
ncbi:NADH dehydrogenase [ubiquinone] 1 alpha subcomplex subunit 1 [Caenorhabditis elegans]|uniref:NADH dehydrogenase [ubiquinone] 1 alpha subcomplex subunit 1 n=1 Tax=Caenorhabditis elegans TaxID=6239 RepID=Q336L1_CAEEL|nr:NADH dehydrogenase [ubiquinone] 1 alpha subcomplex subunit 1 [Caenorhabditis elegans]CCD61308.1 NADH dehydrogenase [ubiquinone] 1 alpha subcomplex subunit 1 [Caenorhabditis elegans]|eukprot:NP_001040630.1 Uncharacterized protein CELE_B0205.13 [Caenorhabditis elegans]